mgnify:CR=1 FL=1
MSLCKYSKVLGEPGKGVHFHVMGIAVVDVILTFVGAYLIQRSLMPSYSYIQVLVGFFLLGIILHRIFCVKTTIDKLLFTNY